MYQVSPRVELVRMRERIHTAPMELADDLKALSEIYPLDALPIGMAALYLWAEQAGRSAVRTSPDVARRPVGSLSGFQLTWFYYSYSHLYASILGGTQFPGGAMLLFRKTALLGAAIMTPVMANILMINVFFHIAVGAECTAAFIFASMLAILWRERAAFVDLFWSRQTVEPVNSMKFHRSIAALVVLVVIAQVVFVLLYRLKVSN